MSVLQTRERVCYLMFDCKIPIVPVVTVTSPEQAVPLANALSDGGLTAIEITLRTECACEAIRLIRQALPELFIGAGSVRTEVDLQLALDAGSNFLVSPGNTPDLLAAAAGCPVPFLPGVASASDLMRCMDAGFSTVKLFPASVVGGVELIRALSGPFPDARFVPTGGVNPENLLSYLSLESVVAVGGSWMVVEKLLDAADWHAVTTLSSKAVDLCARDRPFNTE